VALRTRDIVRGLPTLSTH